MAMTAMEVAAAAKGEPDCRSVAVGGVVAAVIRVIVVGVASMGSSRAMPMAPMSPTAAMTVTAIVNRFGVGTGLLLWSAKIADGRSKG